MIIYNIRNNAVLFIIHLFRCPHMVMVALETENSHKQFQENAIPTFLDLITPSNQPRPVTLD
jgi:hypothetical protein